MAFSIAVAPSGKGGGGEIQLLSGREEEGGKEGRGKYLHIQEGGERD